jgi:hypothetical protein
MKYVMLAAVAAGAVAAAVYLGAKMADRAFANMATITALEAG